LTECRLRRATLVIAKLDRLARDAHFLLGLQRSGIAFTAADMPNANRLTVGIMTMVTEEERRAISERTKAALAAAKARGVKLGGRPESLKNRKLGRQRAREARRAKAAARAEDLAPVIEAIRAQGITSATGIARALNERGIPTAAGAASTAASKHLKDRRSA
jgi:DNA invertase Pin-like site-specific DNA recombinase